MALRLSTAMGLMLTLGLVTACGDDEEVAVEDTDAEVVVEEEVVEPVEEIADGAVSTDETVVADEEPEVVVVEEEEPDAEVIAEAGDDEAIELETDVESDGEPITATAGAETEEPVVDAEEPAADAEVVVIEEEVPVVEVEPADTDVAEVETDAEPLETDTDVAEADTAVVVETDEPATEEAEGDDAGLITLDTNVTTVDPDAPTEQDVEQALGDDIAADEGGLDAEAQVAADAPEEAQTEEINDVATDGIDSASEAEMLDLDNLVLDDAGVQRLTTFVEDSEQISATQKVAIVAGLDAARDNPERLAELLEQVRELTGGQ